MATAKETTKKTTPKKATKKKEEIETKVEESTQVELLMAQMAEMMKLVQSQQEQIQSQQEQLDKKEVKVDTKKEEIKSTPTGLRLKLKKERGEEEVLVRSIAGENSIVGFTSKKTGMRYVWRSNSDYEYLTINEIFLMYNTSRKLLTTPLLIIEDEEVNRALELNNSVNSVEGLEDIDLLLGKTPSEIESILMNASKEYRQVFSGAVLNKIRNKEIRDVYFISEIGKMLGVDYKLYL